MAEQKIRVVLVDDQRLLREGLRIIIASAPDIVVIGEAEDGIAATTLVAAEKPDVLLMDIRMPLRDGITATREIRQLAPETRIILLTTYDAPEQLIEGLRAGAMGYLLKDCSAEELCAAVRAVARGQVLVQAQSAAHLLAGMTVPSPSTTRKPEDSSGLTEREQEVLRLIARGYNNSKIARDLSVSEATVKTHVNHIFAKLGARDRAHAVVLAHQMNLT